MKYPPTLRQWFDDMQSAIATQTFVKMAFTKPTDRAGDLKTIDIRLITVKRELKLSFTYHHKTKDIVKNYTPEESLPILAKLMADTFTSAKLFTLKNDILLLKQGKNLEITYHGATQTTVPDTSHDRAKNRILEVGQGADAKPYLHLLGLTDAKGEVLKSAQDKFRQINKYIEVLDSLIKQLPETSTPIRVTDMGSGKGYLTFALYDHLTNTLKRPTEVVGIEYRQDMVDLCNAIAKKSNFTNLKFTQGTIADTSLNTQHSTLNTEIVIALHACDTATDDAIAKAIKANAALIVTAPCCHKQVRRGMKAPGTHPLNFMLKFGTYEEKMAEMVTDALRAQYLELAGYTTNLFEFIGAEHTPKNVMITAVRNTTPLSANARQHIEKTITEAKAHFGLKSHQLGTLLGL